MSDRTRHSPSWPRDWLDGRGHGRTSALERQLISGQAADPERRPEALISLLEERSNELARRVTELERLLAAEKRPRQRPRRASRRRAAPPDEYWLRRCEGFVVDAPSGEVGIVEGIRFQSRHDRPDELEVRVGRLLPEVILVPVGEVEDISAEAEQIVLRHDPQRRPRHRLASRLRLRTPTRLRARSVTH